MPRKGSWTRRYIECVGHGGASSFQPNTQRTRGAPVRNFVGKAYRTGIERVLTELLTGTAANPSRGATTPPWTGPNAVACCASVFNPSPSWFSCKSVTTDRNPFHATLILLTHLQRR